MSFDLAEISAAVAARGAVVRIVIAAHQGSTPRETGTAMLVWKGGSSGTIGGGALEHDTMARAARMLAEDADRALVTQPLGPALGQCCGGSATLLFERFTAELLERVPDEGVFARPTRGSADDPPLEVQRILRQVRSGEGKAKPALVTRWFVEPVSAQRTPLWIFGAGHVGRALVGVLEGLPYQVTWVDDHKDRFPETIPQGIDRLIATRPQDAVPHAPTDAAYLVLTYSHALDLEICHAVLSGRFGTLGLIGSATKRARFLKRLTELGHPPETLARLTCPIGDRSLGKHPQAIAVGVVHGLLKQKATLESGAKNRGHVA